MKKKLVMVTMVLFMVAFFRGGMSASAANSAVLDAKTGQQVSSMSPYELTTGDSNDLAKCSSYYVMIAPSSMDETSGAAVVPITVPAKGVLFMGVADDFTASKPSTYFNVDIYSDPACNSCIYYSTSDNARVYKFPQGGTYYAKVEYSDYSETLNAQYNSVIALEFANGSNRTLKNNVDTYTGVANTDKAIYYKVKANKAGTITFNVEGQYSSYVTLCNSKKNAITSKKFIAATEGNKVVYGVKKGTYYIKVNTNSDTIKVKSTFKAITQKKNTTKKKATKLQFKKKATTIVLTTDAKGSCAWYKFNNTKKKKVIVMYKSSLTEDLEISFYDAKGEKYGSKKISSGIERTDGFTPYTIVNGFTTKKLSRGTYYIKVKKLNKKGTGTYSITVK